MPTQLAKRPFMLIIRDGWGENPNAEMDAYNAVKLGKHPVDDRLMREYPNVLIHTSGEDVGLPAGVMGNSEVGHQNIGAGRIVDQETMRITRRIRDGSFFKNPTLIAAFEHAVKNNSRVHILGLCSDGRVHSDQEHCYALLELAKRLNFPGNRVYVNSITDGRDTAPQSGIRFLAALWKPRRRKWALAASPRFAGSCYYMMDRDNRWDRVEKAYKLLTEGAGGTYSSADAALVHYYANATESSRSGDEFVMPSRIAPNPQDWQGNIADNDAVIFFNYRGDRPREITKAFVYSDEQLATEPNGGFKRTVKPQNLLTLRP